jgi:ABC-type transporter Mla subunit MlaD
MPSSKPSSGLQLRWQILLTMVAMSLTMLYLAQLKGAWEAKLTLDFETESAAGLYEGMKVNFKGFEIGKLSRLAISPKGVVNGQVQIREAYVVFMTEGAMLKLTKDKIVTSELTLIRDESQKALLPQNARIAIQRDDLAADFSKRIDPLLDKFQVLLTQIADPKDGIQANLQESRKVMAHTVGVLKESSLAVKAMSDTQSGLPAVLSQTRDTMSALEPAVVQATSTLKELETSLAQTRDTMSSIQPATVQATLTLKELENSLVQTRKTLDTADKMIQNMDETLQDVQSAPLYRWLVPKRKTEGK